MVRATRTSLALLLLCFAFQSLHAQDAPAAPAAPPAQQTEPASQPAPQSSDQPQAAPVPAPQPEVTNSDAAASDSKPSKDLPRPEKSDKPLPAAEVHNPILWQDPGDISKLNLFYGLGGEKHQPKPPFCLPRRRQEWDQPEVRRARCRWQEMACKARRRGSP